MDGKSLHISEDKRQQLQAIFPEAFTEGEIDWEKLRLALGDDLNVENERYVLNWAGKSDAFRNLQTPTTATLAPAPEESINFDTTENIFIEGENLEVLKILQKSYYGKIKMIYIDPPYNTGSDSFVYPDDFSESREAYLQRIQAKDEAGFLLKDGQFRQNSKDSGRYHSNWLSMMYPRLYLARNLLKEDGVIFVSIDDNEVHNLRLLMNEIFGEENFFAQIPWQSRTSVQNDTDISIQHEYIIGYAKFRRREHRRLKETNFDIWYELPGFAAYPLPVDTSRYDNPDNDPRGLWKADPFDAPNIRTNLTYAITNPATGETHWPPEGRCWRTEEENYINLLEDGRIIFGKTGNARPQLKVFYNEKRNFGEVPTSWYSGDKYGTGTNGTQELQELFNGISPFTFPKPTTLIMALLQLSTKENDLVLDFFTGSGTTGHAIFKQNILDSLSRKFICVQIEEPSGNEQFPTIIEIGKERIRRVINQIKEENPLFAEQGQDLGFKVFKIKHSNFKLWRGDGIGSGEDLEQQLHLLEQPVLEEVTEENMLYELLLKSGYPLTAAIEEVQAGSGHYFLVEGALAIALSDLDEALLADILARHPQQLICLDSLFEKNDALKTNTQLQCKDAGVTFHSI